MNPDSGDATAVKHFSMGRLSFELATLLPDGKTAYMGDDGDQRVLNKFVAKTAGDLSCGTLYAAQVTQLKSDVPGACGPREFSVWAAGGGSHT